MQKFWIHLNALSAALALCSKPWLCTSFESRCTKGSSLSLLPTCSTFNLFFFVHPLACLNAAIYHYDMYTFEAHKNGKICLGQAPKHLHMYMEPAISKSSQIMLKNDSAGIIPSFSATPRGSSSQLPLPMQPTLTSPESPPFPKLDPPAAPHWRK